MIKEINWEKDDIMSPLFESDNIYHDVKIVEKNMFNPLNDFYDIVLKYINDGKMYFEEKENDIIWGFWLDLD